MKIYLDFVFLLNFFFDFLLLYGTKKILKETVSFRRLLLGSFVAASSVFLLFLPLSSLSLFLMKAGMSIGIILITFGRNNFWKDLLYFYLLSIILGGTLYLFDIGISYQNQGILFVKNGLSINFFILVIGAPLILFLYVKEHKKYKNICSNIYHVEIYSGGKQYQFRGMLDTGNQLRDPYKKRSVILIQRKIPIPKEKFIYVPYKALNTSGIIPCFLPERVIVEDQVFTNCLIGLSKDTFSLPGVECILPNQFKEEL